MNKKELIEQAIYHAKQVEYHHSKLFDIVELIKDKLPPDEREKFEAMLGINRTKH